MPSEDSGLPSNLPLLLTEIGSSHESATWENQALRILLRFEGSLGLCRVKYHADEKDDQGLTAEKSKYKASM
jgi:hypothetical protein